MGCKSKGYVSSHGYLVLNRTYGHRILIESVLGKPIPKGAVCHHIDGNKKNNINSNLVLCESHSYHVWLHQRENALKETGNPKLRKCTYCHQYDEPSKMYFHPKIKHSFHRKCHTEYEKIRRLK